MKTLIAYASKTGTAEKCARMLAERLPDATLCDLCKEKPDPGAYDQVIVGGGVRMGALHVDARQYLDGCKPVYEVLPGWQMDIATCREYEHLPSEARDYVEFIEKNVACPIKFVSVGAERDSLIIR